MRNLVAIPVFNEERHLGGVLRQVLEHDVDVMVVNDGSTDRTADVLAAYPKVKVIAKPRNEGYGASLISAFDYAVAHGYVAVLTMDSDGQHAPSFVPTCFSALADADIVSGTRYAQEFAVNTDAPLTRRRINQLVTDELNASLGLQLSDAFCGFKAYRTSALRRLRLTELGYGMPLELWVQAACLKLTIHELPVPRVYLDLNRSFGAVLDDSTQRLKYYQSVMDTALAQARHQHGCGLSAGRNPVIWKTPAS